ncbi:MAG: Bug family tripartite tricarboxylate transporter substrate binding protein [Burkholderiales bacterium]
MPALVGLAATCGSGSAAAQEVAFPTRAVQIVVPYTPGTGADILSRTLGPKLSERWKVAVVTDNRPGATGNIGAEFVSKATPDGHTVLFTATSFGTTPALYRNLPFDPVKSFAPVILIATSGLALVVHPQLPVKSVKEFIQLAKRRPGQMHYSSPGNGGPQHLAMELFKLETGIDIVHVPYKGLAGAITDVMAGHVQAMISATQTAHSGVQSGRLRVLAVMSPERSSAYPDAPTVKELGLANVEVETWYGSFAPARTPAPIVAKFNAELNALLKLPDVRESLAKQGMTPRGGSPERFGDMVRAELARWDRVVKAANIKAD